MLWSGRGRINGRQDLERAKTVCEELELQGLVIVGGDGSNSNAALMSEYFAAHQLSSCCVIGVPKTIDGDLRNPWIETSFGFDTAAKTYSELIGNLCTDVTTAQVRCDLHRYESDFSASLSLHSSHGTFCLSSCDGMCTSNTPEFGAHWRRG